MTYFPVAEIDPNIEDYPDTKIIICESVNYENSTYHLFYDNKGRCPAPNPCYYGCPNVSYRKIGPEVEQKIYKYENVCYDTDNVYFEHATIREFETLTDCQASLPRR